METTRKPLLAGCNTLTMTIIQIDHQKEDGLKRTGASTNEICTYVNPKSEYILVYFLTGMNFAVTLLPIFSLSTTTVVTSCTASYSVQGQALQNHIFKEETAERLVDCIALCTAYPGCHSSNFYRVEKRCELNDKTHTSHPQDMVHVPYTIYMENIFRSKSCRNNLDCERQMICSSSLICEGMPWAKVM